MRKNLLRQYQPHRHQPRHLISKPKRMVLARMQAGTVSLLPRDSSRAPRSRFVGLLQCSPADRLYVPQLPSSSLPVSKHDLQHQNCSPNRTGGKGVFYSIKTRGLLPFSKNYFPVVIQTLVCLAQRLKFPTSVMKI